MAERALSEQGERHLVLDYLLGRPVKHLVELYAIPRQTIYRILARHHVDRERKS